MTEGKAWVKALGALSWFLKIAQVGVAALWKVPTEKLPRSIAPVAAWIQNWAWILLISIPILLVVVEFCQSKLTIPWFRKALREALDSLQERGFSDVEDPLDHHRVTLFKHQFWCWRCLPFRGGFMVPKLRSGHLTQRTGTIFRVPDRAEQAEGIAGMAFRTGKTVTITGLPDLCSKNAGDQDFELYAEKTYVSVKWLRKRQPHARSYMGIPIKLGGTIRWVLVVDSREPNATRSLSRIEKRYSTVSTYFLKLLENMP